MRALLMPDVPLRKLDDAQLATEMKRIAEHYREGNECGHAADCYSPHEHEYGCTCECMCESVADLLNDAADRLTAEPRLGDKCADCGDPFLYGLQAVAVEPGEFVCRKCWGKRNG